MEAEIRRLIAETAYEIQEAVFKERERCAKIAASFKIEGAVPDEYEGGCDSTASLIEEMIWDGVEV